jgi:hypothetical protein
MFLPDQNASASSKPSAASKALSMQGKGLGQLPPDRFERFKRVIGGGLQSRTDGHRAAEVAIAVRTLNRMLDLGQSEYVRVA